MMDLAGSSATGAETLGTGGRRVAIIGGGIAGLAAAHRLTERAPGIEVTVLEAGTRPGGVLRSSRTDGFLIESGADSFITAVPWGLDLCRRIGLDPELVPTDPGRRRAFVVRRGRLEPIPEGLMIMAPGRLLPVLTSPILSLRGKLRLACEPIIRRGTGDDESLASFARRRCGREAYERLIQPLVGGIYTGDPDRLSLKATMPRFLEMEQAHGSLLRAVRRRTSSRDRKQQSGSGARYGMFVAPREGMSRLADAIVRRLPVGAVRCGMKVERFDRRPEGGWSVRVEGLESVDADAVILAVPAPEAARLLDGVDADLADRVGRIPMAGCAIVSLGYRREQIAHPMDGFGFVVPMVERRPILSGSFSSLKFPGRAPDGSVLVRVFLGGAGRPDLLDLDDDDLIAVARDELARLLGIRGEPVLRLINRWRSVMPQYHVGHLDLVASIEARTADLPGLALAGNAYRGVGVPHCIHSGERAAERIATAMSAIAPGQAIGTV